MLKTTDGDVRVVNFNAAVYGCNAIRKAAHRFRGRLSVHIEQRGPINEVRLIQGAHCNSFSTLVREFCNDVLEQELSERVACEMVGIRDLLLARASVPPLANCA